MSPGTRAFNFFIFMSLNYLVARRKNIRASVTRICNDSDSFPGYDINARNMLSNKLKDLRVRLEELDPKIAELKFQAAEDETVLNNEYSDCENYEDNIRECLTLLADVSAYTVPVVSSDGPRSLLKSPQAPLPVFNSQPGESFEVFISNFEETTSKFKYTDYDKFLLLKQQIHGKALFLIDSLEPGSQTFNKAKDLLSSALASRPILIANILNQLIELKLGYNNEPFKYMSDMQKIKQTFEKLTISTDEILEHFFLKGMNEHFRTQLVLVTNNSRPCWDEINRNFFLANERYLANQALYRKSKSENKGDAPVKPKYFAGNSASYAIAVDSSNSKNPFSHCPLCNDSSHGINKCSKFATPAEKIARLKNIDACLKCTSADHNASRCKFRFNKPCFSCKGWHFTFVCSKPVESTKLKDSEKFNFPKKADSLNTHNKMVVSNCFGGGSRFDSILGTISCSLPNGSVVRALRDSGSQNNFVPENFLTENNHVVLESGIELTVNGINDRKTYQSKLVQMKVKIGDNEFLLEFLTLPQIDIVLDLPGLSEIVKDFSGKGYQLADKDLKFCGNRISDINLILGTDAGHCFTDRTVHFGKSSTFIETEFGIVLVGNISKMLNDLKLLPVNKNQDSSCYTVNISSLNENLSKTALEERLPDGILEFKGLDSECSHVLGKDLLYNPNEPSDLDEKLVKFCLDNASRDDDGRIVMPLLWNAKVKHHLANNLSLAKNILRSCYKKYSKFPEKLKMIDDNFKELEGLNVIKRIPNLENFLKETPSASFLGHMSVFRPSKETTKCRTVFLSNVCDKGSGPIPSINHNMAMHPGPCLNQKLTSSLLLLRFDPKLLIFDLEKAFCMIGLKDDDASKLCFLWYRDVQKGDYTLQAYKNVRLPFGLVCSPTLLMLSLNIILLNPAMEESADITNLKKLIYALTYMDNCAVTSTSSEYLMWAKSQLGEIFSPYKFTLQQFCSNDQLLQEEFSLDQGPVDLLGLKWDTVSDTLTVKKFELNCHASTKREILKTVASCYDPYNFLGPMLNRARIFLHGLQTNSTLGWDKKLSDADCREWRNICKQWNAAPPISLPRFVGNRDDDYRLITFTDSSNQIYGCTIFIQNLKDKSVNFLMSKNRLVSKQLEPKTTPALEFNAIVLGVETMRDLFIDISGPKALVPISVKELCIYSDSAVSLSWINSFANLDKNNKRTVFIRNRLERLDRLCSTCPVVFSFVDGVSNPADKITRCLSHKQLVNSNYFTGPEFLKSGDLPCRADFLTVKLPCKFKEQVSLTANTVISGNVTTKNPINLERYSSLQKLISTFVNVLKFCNALKRAVKRKNKCSNLVEVSDENSFAFKFLVKLEQMEHLTDEVVYFNDPKSGIKCIPNLVKQLNVFMDKEGLLRVGSKTVKFKNTEKYFPVLLPKGSLLTKLIIEQAHTKLRHGGVYSTLNELRKKFWIPSCFSVVKKILKQCLHCRRFNARTVKLNQSMYRDFRIDPPNFAFSYVWLDILGSYTVKINSKNTKVWILIVGCMWSRAINLKLMLNMSTDEFLRAFQRHTFDFGLPTKVRSDLGTQLVAGADVIRNFLNDHETLAYFKNNGSNIVDFDQYYKGNSELGSMIESLVKIVKRLISGSVGKNILDCRDFEFFMEEARHLSNKRPVAFKEALRDVNISDVPAPITPEALIYGHDLLSSNIIPALQPMETKDVDWENFCPSKIRKSFDKLRDIRGNLKEKYASEFLANLISQATDRPDKYVPIQHDKIAVGDLVLIKEQFAKPSSFPLGRILSVQVNQLGEVTGAEIKKGSTGEIVKRHSSALVPFLRCQDSEQVQRGSSDAATASGCTSQPIRIRSAPQRASATEATKRLRAMF